MEAFILSLTLHESVPRLDLPMPDEATCLKQGARWMREARRWTARNGMPPVDGPMWSCWPAAWTVRVRS